MKDKQPTSTIMSPDSAPPLLAASNETTESHPSIFVTYIEEQICLTVHSYRRPLGLCIALALLYQYWCVCLFVNQYSIDTIRATYQIFPYLNSITLLAEFDYSFAIVMIGLGVSLLVFLLFAADIMILKLYGTHYHRSNTPGITKMRCTLSLILSAYSHTLFIPFVYHSVAIFSEYPYCSIPLLVTAVLICQIFALYGRSYSFSNTDQLLDRSTFFIQLTTRTLEILACVTLYDFGDYFYALLVMPIVLALFRLYLILFKHYMNSEFMLLVQLFLMQLQLLIPIIICVCVCFEIHQTTFLALLFIIPFTFALSHQNYQRLLDFYGLKNSQGVYTNKRDFLIRQLANAMTRLEFEDYKTRADSLFFDEIAVDHIVSCEEYPRCFCSAENYKDFEEYKEYVVSSKIRQRFLHCFIQTAFISFCDVKKNSQFLCAELSYICYLIEVKQSKIQAFCEIIKLASMNQHLPWYYKSYLFEFFNQAKDTFDNNALNSSNTNSRSKNSKTKIKGKDGDQQIITTQPGSSQFSASFSFPQETDFFQGIKFDEDLNELEKIYFDALTEKESYVKMLCGDYIDLEILRRKAISYSTKRSKTENKLKQLSQVHYSSQKLQFYLDRYLTLMSFGQRKKAIFNASNRKDNKRRSSRNNKTSYQKEVKTDSSIFEKDNCVVFVTLLGQIGIVKRVQNKFENMFGIAPSKIIGMNISTIIPEIIARQHDAILRDYINQQDMKGVDAATTGAGGASNGTTTTSNGMNSNSRNSVMQRNEILIAKNSKGWALPVALAFRADYIGLEDFGLTGHLTKIKTESVFVLTTVESFQVQVMSERLYLRVFKDYASENDVSKMYLNRVIPLLPFFEDPSADQWSDGGIRTVAFLPKKSQSLKSLSYSSVSGASQRRKKLFIFEEMLNDAFEQGLKTYSMQQMEMFAVKIRVYTKRGRYVQYNVVEIQSMKKVVDHYEQKENLILLQNQITKLMKVDYKLNFEQYFEFNHTVPAAMSSDYQSAQQTNKVTSELVTSAGGERSNYLPNFSLRTPLLNGQEEDFFSKKKTRKQTLLSESTQLQTISEVQLKRGNSNKQQPATASFNEGNNNNNNNNSTPTNRDNYQQSTRGGGAAAGMQTSRILSQSNQDLLQTVQNRPGYTDEGGFTEKVAESFFTQANMDYNHNHYMTQNHDPSSSQILLTDRSFIPFVQNHHTVVYTGVGGGGGGEQRPTVADFDYDTNINTNNNMYKADQRLFPTTTTITNTATTNMNIMTIQQDASPRKKKPASSIYSALKKKIVIQGVNQNGDQKVGTTFNSQPEELNNNNKSLMSISSMRDKPNNNNNNFEKSKTTYNNISKDSAQLQYIQQHGFCENDDLQADDMLRNKQNNAAQYYNVNGDAGDSSYYTDDSDQSMTYKQLKKSKAFIEQATSSIHTSKTHNYDQKRILKEQIRSRKGNVLMSSLIAFGVAALSTIIGLTIYQYVSVTKQLKLARDYFSFIPWPMSIRSEYSDVMLQGSVLAFIKNNVFTDITANDYEAKTEKQRLKSTNAFVDLYQTYQDADMDNIGFLDYFSTMINFTFSVDDLVSADILTYNSDEKSAVSITLDYFINLMSGYLFLQTKYYDDRVAYQKIQIDNFALFNSYLVTVQSMIYSEAIDLIDQIILQSLILLIVVIIGTVIMIMAIFPLYYAVQLKNEQLLKLFATISPEYLKVMLMPILIAQGERKGSSNTAGSSALRAQQVDNYKKRKIISATGTLPKFKVSFAFFSMISFCLIIVQPIVNFILIKSFQTEAEANIKFSINLYEVKATFISSTAVNLEYILNLMVPTEPIYWIQYYANRVSGILTTNTNKLASMYSTINENQSSSRYQQHYYDDFLYVVLQGNLCEAFRAYPQFISDENYIAYDDCITIRNGYFKQGFEVNVLAFSQIFIEWSQFYADSTIVYDSLFTWESNFKFQEFMQYKDYLFDIITVVKDFMTTMMNDQLNMIELVQLLLLIFQLLLLIVVFCLGWMKFFFYVQSDMYTVKSLLTTLSIEVVLDNPYIVSFLGK